MWRNRILLHSFILALFVPGAAGAMSLAPAWQTTWAWDTPPRVMNQQVGWRTHQPRVHHSAVGDVDGDATLDLVRAIWRPGAFGPVRPRWVTRDTDAMLPHVDVVNPVNQEPTWQSSAIDFPVCDLRLVDLTLDGRDELVVLEGRWQRDYACRGGRVAVWEWTGWGFQLVWRSPPAQYHWVEITKQDGGEIRLSAGS